MIYPQALDSAKEAVNGPPRHQVRCPLAEVPRYALVAPAARHLAMLDVQLYQSPPLPLREARFVPPPAEMVMLAGVWSPAPLPSGWFMEEKIDGVRATYVDGQLLSREGAPIECAPHVFAELALLETRFGHAMMFDGEYQEPGGLPATLSVLASRGRREAHGTFHLFDAVPLEEWRSNTSQLPLTARRASIVKAWADWRPQWVRLIEQQPATMAGAQAAAALIWKSGGEGILLKDGRSFYRRQRSKAWLKWKKPIASSCSGFEPASKFSRR